MTPLLSQVQYRRRSLPRVGATKRLPRGSLVPSPCTRYTGACLRRAGKRWSLKQGVAIRTNGMAWFSTPLKNRWDHAILPH